MMRYASRKFALAAVALAASSAALLMGNMTGGEYAACLTAILGLYGTVNVWNKKVTQ